MNYEKKILHDQKITLLHNSIVDMEILLTRYAKQKQNDYIKAGFSDAGIKVASDRVFMQREELINKLKDVLKFLKDDFNENYKK